MRTKTILFLLTSILTMTVILFQSCKKDSPKTEEPEIEYTEDGLQVGEPPMQQDLIIVDTTTMQIKVDQAVIPDDLEKDYVLQLNGFEASELKPGMVIADFSENGRIWVVKEVSPNKSVTTVIANLGTLATLLTNVVMEVSTAGNRAKMQSDNPNKLEWGKFKMISGNGDPVIEFNINNINIGEIYNQNGVEISVNANNVELNFTDFEVYRNESGTFAVTVPNGLVEVNNAVDFKVRFNPISGFYFGIPMTLGSIKEYKSSIYSVVDSDITLNIQATTNGTVGLVNYDKEIGSYKKFVPIPPYFFMVVQVDLKAKLSIDTEAEFNVTPHYITKDNFEMRVDYNGLLADNDLSVYSQNIENEVATNINGDFNLGQRLEIVPEVRILAYGLLGPSGKIITYEKLELDAELNNDLVNWDVDLDVGMDYYASMDVSFLNYGNTTQSILNKQGNLFNFDLYNAPYQSEIISGNNQTGETGSLLAEPIKVRVKDNFNNAIPYVAIHFETETNNGTFENDYVYTNMEGIAENNWTLGNTVSTQSANIFVEDGEGNTITGTQLSINATATSSGSNTPPTALFSVSPTSGTTTSNFAFDASGSTDNEDPTSQLEVRWDFDGNGSWDTSWDADKTISHQYTSEGTYNATIEVKDTEGLTNEYSKSITVSNDNTPPTAFFTISPSSGTTSTNFVFDASGSSDNEDPTSQLEVRWDFDGNGSWDTSWDTDKTITHQYSSEGTYNATLEVKDTEGLTDEYSISIIISNGGGSGIFTDPRDGQTYNTVTIGNQTWFAENLNYETSNSWWYNNSSANGDVYGRLYTWDAALTACPAGWHLPSDEEWKTLEMALGMSQSEADAEGWRGTDEGGKMKETGTTHWTSPNYGATNSSGFSALPGGSLNDGSNFDYVGSSGIWWSATEWEYNSTCAWCRSLYTVFVDVSRDRPSKESGFSVRCVRD